MFNKLIQYIKEPTTAKLLSGGGIVLFFKVLGALGGYFLLFSLAQKGGETAVGVYEVAFTVLLIGSTMGRFGLDTVLVRELGTKSSPQFNRSLYLAILLRTLLFSAFIALILFTFAAYFTALFFDESPTSVLRTAALAIVPFTWMLLNAEAYRGLQKPMLFSLNQHGTVYILIAVILLLFPLQHTPFSNAQSAQFALILLVGLSSLFALLTSIHLLTQLKGRQPYPSQLQRKLYKTATPMLISSALFLVVSWSDTLMLSYFLSEDQVGVYRIAFKIATLITFAQFALNAVIAPMVSELHSGGENMAFLAKKVAHLNLITAGPIFLSIIILGPFLLQMFDIQNPNAAYPFLAVLSLGQLANAFSGPVLNILNMTGYEQSARNTMLVIATLNILLNALLIPLWGLMGAATATSLTMIGWNFWAAYLVYKFHGVITVPFFAHKSKGHVPQ